MTTVKEWSDAFDVAVASYLRITAPGYTDPLSFDEYEKSLFLTRAQEEIVKGLYKGTLTGDSFEKTEEIRRLLNPLVIQNTQPLVESPTNLYDRFKHYSCIIPEDCLYIIYEQVTTGESDKPCSNQKVLEVYPTTHDEYSRISKNPFRGPSDNRVLRLDKGEESIEIVSTMDITEYLARYLTKPTPIVLDSFYTEDVSISGISTPTPCYLPEVLHQTILDYAVKLAINSRISNNK